MPNDAARTVWVRVPRNSDVAVPLSRPLLRGTTRRGTALESPCIAAPAVVTPERATVAAPTFGPAARRLPVPRGTTRRPSDTSELVRVNTPIFPILWLGVIPGFIRVRIALFINGYMVLKASPVTKSVSWTAPRGIAPEPGIMIAPFDATPRAARSSKSASNKRAQKANCFIVA